MGALRWALKIAFNSVIVCGSIERPMTRLSLAIFGGFQARLESGKTLALTMKKAQALLAYLALPPGQAHPRDKLAALLWGGMRKEQARASVRQAVFAIRRALGTADCRALVLDGENLTLDPTAVEVDAAVFERLAGAGTPADLEKAMTLYRGDLLAGLAVDEPPFEEWLLSERERLHELALDALAKLLAHQRKAGDAEAAVQSALRLLALDPLQESVHRALMRLYAEQGRRGAALRQYQHCVTVLQRELGVEPEAGTKRLYQEILRQRSGRPSVADVTPTTESPAASAGIARAQLPAADTPLVGREPEVDRLHRALAAAWSGRGQLVTLIGEAGIGKTRLVTELAVDAEQRGALVLLGRSYESEQVLPFGPWVDALRAGRVMSDLAGLAPAWRGELARLIPELAGPEATPTAADYLKLFESVAEAIGHLARPQPMLLVLEDLHWADEMSVRLLAFVGRRLRRWPVLLLATAREEELADASLLRHTLEDLGGEADLTAVTLGPLSRANTLALVGTLVRVGSADEATARLGEQVWTSSNGNPFVAVETIRAHAQGAAPVQGRGLALPQRVREIVSRRLERLSGRSRSLVAAAAAIGREFDFALLQQAAGLGEVEAAEGVEELVRRRILHGVGDGFGFTHERICEVAYDAVLDVRRRTLHAAVGAALERLHAGRLEAVYDRLAYHWLRAEDPAKAAEYLARFARRSARAYAHEDAVKAYSEALRQLERLPVPEADARRVDIVPRLARSLMFLGRFEEARDLLLAQREPVEKADSPWLTGQFYLLLSHVYTFLGDRDRTVESARQAIAAAERAADESTLGKALYVLAMEGWWSGDPTHGIEHGRLAVELLERTSERWWLGQAHFAVAANHVLRGDFDPAIEAATKALAIGDALGDPRVQTPAAWLTGTIHAMRGDWDEGIAAGRRSLDYSPDPLNRADALGWLGFAYLEKGDAAEAIRLLEQSVELWSTFRVRPAQGAFQILLGHAYLMRGEVERAAQLAEAGLALARDTGYRLAIGWGKRLQALIEAGRGDRGAARALLEQALTTFVSISGGFEAARTRLLLAEVCAAVGDGSAAAGLLAEASKAFATLRTRRYACWTDALAAELGASPAQNLSKMAGDRIPRWA
jgi:DNA-binding SARP family transcriptional activator/KaiC/GvpD/RAD55 family RecA-like ATPase